VSKTQENDPGFMFVFIPFFGVLDSYDSAVTLDLKIRVYSGSTDGRRDQLPRALKQVVLRR
jgi:hypothetical protein